MLSASLTTGNNGNSTTFDGVISGSGGLTKVGSGTFALSRGNTYIGGTIIDSGTLLVNNTIGSGTGAGAVVVNAGATLGGSGTITGSVTVNSGAHIAPGASIGSIDFGSLALAADSILDFELDTILDVHTSDLINVTVANGLMMSGGTLNLTNAANMTAGTYTLIVYTGTLNGSISDLALGSVPTGFTYSLVNNTSNKSIDLVVVPIIPGDFNFDGNVDGADYVEWRKDPDSNGGNLGYNLWRANFGTTGGSGAALPSAESLSVAVPEPASIVISILPMVSILFWRR